MTMSWILQVDSYVGGKLLEVELVPGGGEKLVTEENKWVRYSNGIFDRIVNQSLSAVLKQRTVIHRF